MNRPAPHQVWFKEQAQAHDTGFQTPILRFARPLDLWIFDRGFYDFSFFGRLIAKGAALITRAKSNLVFEVCEVMVYTDRVRDRLITVADCQYPLRLIEVLVGTTWYRYLTRVTDPTVLPVHLVVDLYRRRWRIEEAFFIVKRLLNLSYSRGLARSMACCFRSGVRGYSMPCSSIWAMRWLKNFTFPLSASLWRGCFGDFTTSPERMNEGRPMTR